MTQEQIEQLKDAVKHLYKLDTLLSQIPDKRARNIRADLEPLIVDVADLVPPETKKKK